MKKLLILYGISMLLLISIVSAEEQLYNSLPDGKTIEQFKQDVLEANNDPKVLATGTQTNGHWGLCGQYCADFKSKGDCEPCASGEIESNTVWEFSQPVSSTPALYCKSQPGTSFYTKESYCTSPSTTCSGGADFGDTKCQSGDVYECSNGGAWEIKESCDNGCSNGVCQEQTCQSHASQSCVGNTVYWMNSCGQAEGENFRCNANEQCQNNACIPISNPDVCAKDEDCGTYQSCNLSTAKCVDLPACDGVIQNHVCVPNEPGNGEGLSSQTITGFIIGGVLLVGAGVAYNQRPSKKRTRKQRGQ